MPSAKTFAANKSLPPLDGLVFPITGKDKNGADERSTQVTGKNCVAAALAAVDKEAAEACRNEKGWRFKYIKHIVKSVELSASSPEAALKVSAAGLKALHETFEFVRDGKTMSFAKAMSDIKSSFATGHIKGEKPKPASFELGVPYKGQTLTGDALQTQLDKWVRLGVIELSAGAQISQVARSAPWLDLSDRYFVLLGAGAAMGPFQLLLNHGANVIAVDLDRPEIWERLITAARNSCGSITFPLKEGTAQEKCSTAPGTVGADGKKTYGADSLYSKAGCNLFTQTPEIKNWVTTVHPGKQLVVGGYAFLPGDLFPRVSLAMDAIIAELVKQRKASVAFLCTPTDVHLVPPAAAAAAKENFNRAPLWTHVLALLSKACPPAYAMCRKNFRKPIVTAAGETLHVCDALVSPQGPNYALAKRLQHWRAMLARDAGCIVSSNIAPSTSTVSVTQNKQFGMVYAALHNFKPYEVPGPETSNAVMTALLIHDLNEPMHAGHPDMPLASPLQIFSQGSFHGGTWRCGFSYNTIGVPAVLIFYLNVLVKWYLVAYNAVQTFGWSLVLIGAVSVLTADGGADASPTAAWDAFGTTLTFYQNLAALEIVHAYLGMVRSGLANTAMQIFSRLVVVNMVSATASLQELTTPLLLVAFAWGITEVVRYSWYGWNTLGKPLAAHTWLRYSTFLLLYPTGVFGEVLIFLASLTPLAAISIPYFGWSFPSAGLIKTIMVAYVPGFPNLFFYMLGQRKKVLGGGKAAGKAKKAQ